MSHIVIAVMVYTGLTLVVGTLLGLLAARVVWWLLAWLLRGID